MQLEGKIYDKSMRNDMHPYSVYIPSNESGVFFFFFFFPSRRLTILLLHNYTFLCFEFSFCYWLWYFSSFLKNICIMTIKFIYIYIYIY